MKKLTAQWVRKAESDFAVAETLARGKEPHHDEVCFHAQQCSEKYLKALLEELGLSVPRTHVFRVLGQVALQRLAATFAAGFLDFALEFP